MGRTLKALGGVTLTEVLFALAILAIAIISLVTLFMSGLRLMTRSSDLQRSNELARRQVEAILEMPALPPGTVSYDGRTNQAPDAATGFPPAPYPSMQVDGKSYAVLCALRPVNANLRSLEVRVFYGPEQSVWVERYLGP